MRSWLSLPTAITLILSFFFATGPAFCDEYEGDACTVDGSPGVCKTLQNCKSVYENLLRGMPPRVTCGYKNYDPVVCCPNKSTPPKITTTPTTTTKRPVPKPHMDSRGPRGSTARAMCEEYAKSVFALVLPPTLTINPKPVNISLCEVKGRKLIVGGKKAEPKEFPHMVAVGYNSADSGIIWGCGGTLISERFVLTAAHCTYDASLKEATWVRVGDLNLERTDDDAKPQQTRIIERIRHPKFKKPAMYHDIALLKLETSIKFDAWARPSCLPYSLSESNSENKATATGWGDVEWAGDRSADLLKVTINLVPQAQCNRTFTRGQARDNRVPNGISPDWQICAGEYGRDTCQGDSGGPLVVFNTDYDCMYSVIGVTSIGKDCGSIIPGVYTRVYHYVPWIESIVWPNS